MIPITRSALSTRLQAKLDTKTRLVASKSTDSVKKFARASWKGSKALRSAISNELRTMSQGRELCMYCSDGQGASTDHYEPIAESPIRVWDWSNHILACVICNSFAKRAKFDRDSSGNPLFLDPTVDDPIDHLTFSPSTGAYVGRTDKGTYTADELLNRELLARGRRAAWLDCLDLLVQYSTAHSSGDFKECLMLQFRLTQRPNLDALYVMIKTSSLSSASDIIPTKTLDAISNHRASFSAWIGI